MHIVPNPAQNNRERVSVMENEKKIDEILADYQPGYTPGDQTALLLILREIQAVNGCLPKEVQQKISQALGEPPQVLSALIRRIPDLKEETSRYQVTICTGPRCADKGGREILKAVERELRLKPGKTSPDGLFSLQTVLCMKKCAQAPNVKINGELYGAMTPKSAVEKLKALRRGARRQK